jgi:hypothetical protein
MKKLKMFSIAAGLVLVTAGVFAGKSNFFAASYYLKNVSTGVETQLTSFPGSNLSQSPTGTGSVINGEIDGTSYQLNYYTSGDVFVPLYFN